MNPTSLADRVAAGDEDEQAGEDHGERGWGGAGGRGGVERDDWFADRVGEAGEHGDGEQPCRRVHRRTLIVVGCLARQRPADHPGQDAAAQDHHGHADDDQAGVAVVAADDDREGAGGQPLQDQKADEGADPAAPDGEHGEGQQGTCREEKTCGVGGFGHRRITRRCR